MPGFLFVLPYGNRKRLAVESEPSINRNHEETQMTDPTATTYAFAEGQLVRLFHNRPEDAHELAQVPTEFLRDAIRWNDRNGDFDDMSHADMLLVALDWYEAALVDELAAYCDAHGLPKMSADELIISMGPAGAEHVRWLSDYCDRWQSMVDLHHVAERA